MASQLSGIFANFVALFVVDIFINAHTNIIDIVTLNCAVDMLDSEFPEVAQEQKGGCRLLRATQRT